MLRPYDMVSNFPVTLLLQLLLRTPLMIFKIHFMFLRPSLALIMVSYQGGVGKCFTASSAVELAMFQMGACNLVGLVLITRFKVPRITTSVVIGLRSYTVHFLDPSTYPTYIETSSHN